MNVADKFNFISREWPRVKEVFFVDIILSVDQQRSLLLSEEIIKRGNKLPFKATSRADNSGETLRHLKNTG